MTAQSSERQAQRSCENPPAFVYQVRCAVRRGRLWGNLAYPTAFSTSSSIIRSTKRSLVRIQREQAKAAAAKISQFVKEIESQLWALTTQLLVVSGSSSNAASMRCGCCARCRPLPSWLSSMPVARSGCGCHALPWTWWRAGPTFQGTQVHGSGGAQGELRGSWSISAANPSRI